MIGKRKLNKIRTSECLSILCILLFFAYSYATGGLIKYLFGNYRNAASLLIASLAVLFFFIIIKRRKISAHYDLIMFVAICIVVFHNNANLKNNDIVNLVMTLGIFALAIALRRTNRWEEPTLKTIVFVSLFFAITSILFGLMPSFYRNNIIPLFSDYNQSNLLHLQASGILCGLTNSNGFNAIIMVNGICVVSTYLITAKTLTGHKWCDRLIWLTFMVVLLMTGKRGPLVFCIAAIFIAYFVFNSNKPASRLVKIFGFIVLIMIAWALGSSMFPKLFPSIRRIVDADSIDVVRLALYDQAINAFKNNPLLGIGWDAFRYKYLTFGNALNVHNIYLQLLCECGVIGTIPFALYFIINCVSAIKKLRRVNMTEKCEAQIQINLTFSVLYQVFFLMYGLTGNPLYDAPTLLVYVLACTAANKIDMRQ